MLTALNLKVFQYVKIIDSATGVIRVVRGEATVFLGATEVWAVAQWSLPPKVDLILTPDGPH